MKKISAILLACSIGIAIEAQTVIDPLTGSLSGYTTTLVLDNGNGNGNGVSFTDSGSGLQANYVGSTATAEQALLLAPASSFSTTFAVGDILSVGVNVPNGPQSGSYTADFGLAIAATVTPPAASSGNSWSSRNLFDWASVSVRPPQSSIRLNTSVSGTLTTGSFVQNNVPSSTVTELFIAWTGAETFQLGYVTNSIPVIAETVTFAGTSTIGTAIGFYADQRDADGGIINSTGVFSDLAIAPVPEPSTLALCGLGIAGLVAWKRRKQ